MKAYQEAAKKLLPIVQAAAEGKTIEFRDRASKCWRKKVATEFTTYTEYRVKPEPKIVYIPEFDDNIDLVEGATRLSRSLFNNQQQCDEYHREVAAYVGAVKFIQYDYVEEENADN